MTDPSKIKPSHTQRAAFIDIRQSSPSQYRLLELCGITDALIGDKHGVYHPALFNDSLLLGLKGAMSEAELHILRARLDGGIRNKAARGELRRSVCAAKAGRIEFD